MTGRSAHAGDVATLRLLSAFELRLNGTPLPLPARSQRLVALLALADRPFPRAAAAAQLWPDVVNARANASLRATLWAFPQAGQDLVAVANTTLVLARSIQVDLVRARAYAAAAIDGSTPDVDPTVEDELREDVLPSWSDEWLVIERERFRQLRLHALDALCVAHARRGRYAQAVTAGLASVSSAPTRESAHRALMTAHLLEGNRMEAIRQYHRYLEIARVEMGIGPSEHLQRLLQMALTDAVDEHSALR